jgi:dihydrofolate reductase
MSSFPLTLVVAVARNGVIGDGNRLIWRQRSDLKRFKALTLGKPIIMGRKTFLSIGKPLPGRSNIILTRDRDFSAGGVFTVHNPDEALAFASDECRRLGADEIIIGGGAEIYALFMARCDKAYVTEVDCAPQGDAHFPWPLPSAWQKVASEAHAPGEGDEFAYRFIDFARLRDKAV